MGARACKLRLTRRETLRATLMRAPQCIDSAVRPPRTVACAIAAGRRASPCTLGPQMFYVIERLMLIHWGPIPATPAQLGDAMSPLPLDYPSCSAYLR